MYFLISAQLLKTFRIFFHNLLTIFACFSCIRVFSPFCTFCNPPMGDPSSTVTLNHTLMTPEPIQPIEDIANWIHLSFWIVSLKIVIFPFFLILTPEDPPLDRCTKHFGAVGPHLRVPPLPPGPTPSPNLRQHTLFSPGGDFDIPQPVVLGIY